MPDTDQDDAMRRTVAALVTETQMLRGLLIAEHALVSALCITHPDIKRLARAARESFDISRDSILFSNLSEEGMQAAETRFSLLLGMLAKFSDPSR